MLLADRIFLLNQYESYRAMNLYCSHEFMGGQMPAKKEKKGGRGVHIYVNLWRTHSQPPPQ